jgi:polar amino acid transport system substrate-binding protein
MSPLFYFGMGFLIPSKKNPMRLQKGGAFLFLCALFLSQAAFAQAQTGSNPAETPPRIVKIGILNDNEPYSWVNSHGVPLGFSVDVLEEVSRDTGVQFEYRPGNWPEVYGAFLRGELDAIDEISFREDRAYQMQFTRPYHFRKTVLMHNSTRPLPPITTAADLKPYRIGVVSDIFYAEALKKEGIELTFYDNLPGLIRALAFGWVDAIVGSEMTLSFLARKSGFVHLAVHSPIPLTAFQMEDFRIAVQKEASELATILDGGLSRITPQTMQTLLEKWQEMGGALLSQKQAFSPTESQKNYLRQLGPVRVGIMRDYAPFSFVEAGHVQGLSMDVLNRLQDMTGLQVIPVTDRWPNLMALFKEGRIDLIANISHTLDREPYTRFTEPYYVIPNMFFVRGPDRHISSLDDLEGLRLGLSAGIFYEDKIRARLGENAIAFTSQSAMFGALAQGQVDVVVTALPNGLHWTREHGLSDVRMAGMLELEGMQGGEDLRFGVRPDLAPLRDILNDALLALSHTERRTIENRWLGARFSGLNGKSDTARNPLILTVAEKRYLDQRDHRLSLCVDPDWLPLEAIDSQGQHTGLSADFMTLLINRFDLQLEVLPSSDWMSSLEAAKAGLCDFVPMLMQTPQREAHFHFTSPYYTTPNVLLGRIEAPFVDALEDFHGKKVGVVKGYAFSELLALRYPHLQLIDVSSEREGLRLVQNREIDAYIGTLITASHHLKETGLADIKVLGRVPLDWTLSMGTRHEDVALHSILQKFVESITDQERRQIEAKWHSMELPEKPNYTLAIQIGLAALVLVALMLAWNRKLGQLNRELAKANGELARISRTDSLTQIGNRVFFEETFKATFDGCLREQTSFMVAMIDIDHFKQINDTYGHRVGDDCLCMLANLLKTHARRHTDRIARLGGEEFVMFSASRNPHETLAWFELLRERAQKLTLLAPEGGALITFSISIGIAAGVPTKGDAPSAFLERADQAMYSAKRAGRNRCMYGGLSGPFRGIATNDGKDRETLGY